MFRTAAVAVVSLAVLALTAGAQREKPKAKLYKTPQEVFDAANTAEQKKDFKTLAGCFAPQTQKEMAALFAVMAVEGRRSAKNEKDAEKREALAKEVKAGNAVLEKHGLTEKATADVKFSDKPKERDETLKTLYGLIKDPEAFLGDVMPTSFMFGNPKKETAKLTDVKIDGDKASGTVVTTNEDKKEKKEPVKFVKVNGGWRVLLPSLDEEKKSDK